ncbi:hypothetical protein QQ045_029038 [Rhodiola kirilowii]
MPETHLESQPTMPKSLKVPTLIQSIRCTFSLRRRLGCSSSSTAAAAVIRMSTKWQPNNNTQHRRTKTKQRKGVIVATTKIGSAARNKRRRHRPQQLVDLESPPPVSPSPASDSSSDFLFSSNKSNTQRPTRHGRGTGPVNTASLHSDSVFRIPRFGDEVIGTRHQHCAPQRSSEELTEILMIQTNLPMGRSDSYDRFRDWRLDTDDMTYEQLLALGDKMGYVSTGLKESEILRCVKKIKYLGKTSSPLDGEAEPKCSICQEEYEPKDKLGLLICTHLYHRDCIKQWLKHKKTCPVCKSEVIARR